MINHFFVFNFVFNTEYDKDLSAELFFEVTKWLLHARCNRKIAEAGVSSDRFDLKAKRSIANLANILSRYPNNDLQLSEIYNQFIFGNAYPADLAVLNEKNVNVFELKKDKLTDNKIPQIEKEIKKHLYYSLFSERIKANNIQRFNFYLIFLKDSGNDQSKRLILEKFHHLCNKINTIRENNISFIEYDVKDDNLIFEEV